MIAKEIVTNGTNGKGCMRKQVDQDTFAWRLMIARESKGLQQTELARLLAEKLAGTNVRPPTQVAISKLEKGMTASQPLAVLAAIADALGESLDWLIAGKHPEEGNHHDVFMTPEAHEVGALVDSLPENLRKVMLQGAQILLNMHEEHERLLRESHDQDIEIAQLLEENINLLAEKHRRLARAYINRKRRRNGA